MKVIKEEENKSPLSMVDWVNYLMQEQSIEYTKIYNKSLSALTIIIVLLTLLSSVLVFMSFVYTFISIDATTIRIIIGVAIVVIFVIIAVVVYAIFIKLPASKKYTDCVTKSETVIINDILNGTEKDIDCILKRYNAIWKICKKN